VRSLCWWSIITEKTSGVKRNSENRLFLWGARGCVSQESWTPRPDAFRFGSIGPGSFRIDTERTRNDRRSIRTGRVMMSTAYDRRRIWYARLMIARYRGDGRSRRWTIEAMDDRGDGRSRRRVAMDDRGDGRSRRWTIEAMDADGTTEAMDADGEL